MLLVVPLSLAKANELVVSLHRHHKARQMHIFSLGLKDDDGVFHGCAIISRPCARAWNDKNWCEVSRLATDGTTNACSMLYSAAARAAKEMGYERILTYILESELGTSLKASGWKYLYTTPHHRPRTYKGKKYEVLETTAENKQLWVRDLQPVPPSVPRVSKPVPPVAELIRLSGKSRATWYRHKKHGKPVREPKPWVLEGVSRTTWYRKREAA